MIVTLDAAVRKEILIEQVGQETQNAFAEADYLHRGAVPGCGRFPLVTSLLRGSHLVHPGAAIGVIAAEHKAGVRINADLIVESAIAHVLVDVPSGESLSEAETLEVYRENFLHHAAQ